MEEKFVVFLSVMIMVDGLVKMFSCGIEFEYISIFVKEFYVIVNKLEVVIWVVFLVLVI